MPKKYGDSFPKLATKQCLNQVLVHLGRCQKSILWLNWVVTRGLCSGNRQAYTQLFNNINFDKNTVIHPIHRTYNYYNEVYKGVLV